jgi:hypothetical protein
LSIRPAKIASGAVHGADRLAGGVRDPLKKRTKVCIASVWRRLDTLRFGRKTRQHALGRRLYCAGSPQPLWVTMSRKRDAQGQWGLWYVVANRPSAAEQAVAESRHSPGCEAGCREA